MKRLAVLVAMLIAACTAAPTFAAVDLDQATKDYLKGNWVTAGQSRSDACGAASVPQYQMDIEFRKSGGRVMDFTKGFPPVARTIIDAKRNGDEISITLASVIGVPEMREVLRIVSPKRIEMRYHQFDHTPYEQYRDLMDHCFVPNRTVNDSIAVEDLQVLSSIGKEIVVFKEAVSGLTDTEICSAREQGIYRQPGETLRVDSLQFEVFGPVHFLVQGRLVDKGWNDKLGNAAIMSIVAAGDGTLKFELSESFATKNADDGKLQRSLFWLTTKWDGKRLFVHEIGKNFVRCRIRTMLGNAEPAPFP